MWKGCSLKTSQELKFFNERHKQLLFASFSVRKPSFVSLIINYLGELRLSIIVKEQPSLPATTMLRVILTIFVQ